MADPIERDTLIVSPTPREGAIASADAAVSDVDAGLILRAGSPDIAQVPSAYLPARAQARSVDVWDETWPDEVKRAVIVAAPDVHRHKGTVYAVKASLGALGIDATITEWWQSVPKGAPYTFTVKAYARARLYDGPLLDARLIRAAYASILSVKPESRAFDLSVGARLIARPGVVPVLIGKAVCARALAPRPVAKFSAVLGLGGVIVPKVRVARALRVILPA